MSGRTNTALVGATTNFLSVKVADELKRRLEQNSSRIKASFARTGQWSTYKLPLFPEAEILASAKAVKLFAYSVSVKDTPLAVDAEVLNDFEGCYYVQLGPPSFPRMKARDNTNRPLRRRWLQKHAPRTFVG